MKNLPYRKGVGIMLFNKEKKIFVGKRLDNQSAWQMPQGGVDQNEDLLSAMKRELAEEWRKTPDGKEAIRVADASMAFLEYMTMHVQRLSLQDPNFLKNIAGFYNEFKLKL